MGIFSNYMSRYPSAIPEKFAQDPEYFSSQIQDALSQARKKRFEYQQQIASASPSMRMGSAGHSNMEDLYFGGKQAEIDEANLTSLARTGEPVTTNVAQGPTFAGGGSVAPAGYTENSLLQAVNQAAQQRGGAGRVGPGPVGGPLTGADVEVERRAKAAAMASMPSENERLGALEAGTAKPFAAPAGFQTRPLPTTPITEESAPYKRAMERKTTKAVSEAGRATKVYEAGPEAYAKGKAEEAALAREKVKAEGMKSAAEVRSRAPILAAAQKAVMEGDIAFANQLLQDAGIDPSELAGVTPQASHATGNTIDIDGKTFTVVATDPDTGEPTKVKDAQGKVYPLIKQ